MEYGESAMFRGYYEHQINDQGRVSLPAKFRQVLEVKYSKKLVLVGLPDRIEAWPEEEYRKKELADLALPSDDPRVLKYLLLQHHNVFEAEYDGAGRILLPPKLRSELGFNREVVFIGLMNRILIFHPAEWEKFLSEAKAQREETSLLVSKLRSELGSHYDRDIPRTGDGG